MSIMKTEPGFFESVYQHMNEKAQKHRKLLGGRSVYCKNGHNLLKTGFYRVCADKNISIRCKECQKECRKTSEKRRKDKLNAERMV